MCVRVCVVGECCVCGCRCVHISAFVSVNHSVCACVCVCVRTCVWVCVCRLSLEEQIIPGLQEKKQNNKYMNKY